MVARKTSSCLQAISRNVQVFAIAKVRSSSLVARLSNAPTLMAAHGIRRLLPGSEMSLHDRHASQEFAESAVAFRRQEAQMRSA